MAQSVNYYKADLRDYKFLLFEQFRIQEILGKGPFEDWDQDSVEMVISEVYKWSCDVLGPLHRTGDAGCKLEDGKVSTPAGFKAAWKSLYEAGWNSLSVSSEYGGQQGPTTLHTMAEEFMSGANTAFTMYPGLTLGVAELIEAHGTDEQKQALCEKLYDGTFGGTMCLTEPHAGSDVGANTTRATPIGDGKYKISGTKIYITGGDQDLSENIIHMVLARTADAPQGTRGLSLFIVPRDRLDGSGSNDVSVAGIEHKMGINGSATCILNFGENDECIGELVGSEEQKGIRQMFHLMNLARIGVGIQGLAVASSAYLNALEYAKDRKQGTDIAQRKDPDAERVPIIRHADVRRMLLDMKCRVEGIRALSVKLTMHNDRARLALESGDEKAAAYHHGQVDLLVPLLKAYATDQSFLICANAIQVYGGAGYLKDWPVEQYCRDSKIFSIYEGTNHIQALDLVGRKLGQKGGMNFQAFAKDVHKFLSENRENEALKEAMQNLSSAIDALTGTAMRFWGWLKAHKIDMVPLVANRFLEMMSETTVGWLLLEGAVIAQKAAAELPESHPDRAYYEGRKFSALYFANDILPGVAFKASLISKEQRQPMLIPEEAFASL
ncbi:acyl-CoA dehydrogenase [Haliangium ochraceum]|uniref:Acyl-CoA dehydrogenase domain protein n=1 Tax=Haliangium ochraceum (strain DSM 14365 / JCM 11303 / SMP-2) TaxID=502025 RepID=D0LVI7_HALO1|nr:acyl-CoA dehydrogenase [Haliangium ochraceum]ACY17548.1 acyl-CoA dehydrogenase domain protein [Haliangium ochraceum DSM 14365]